VRAPRFWHRNILFYLKGITVNKPDFSNISYLRICLFDNATTDDLTLNRRKYKLTVGAKLATSKDFMNFTFAMNTKGTWALRRGKIFETGLAEDSHYKSLLSNYHLIKNAGIADIDCPPRCSKAYQMSGQRGKVAIPFVSAILWSQDHEYQVNLMMGDREWQQGLALTGLTEAERRHNMIAKAVWTTTEAGVFDWSKTTWV